MSNSNKSAGKHGRDQRESERNDAQATVEGLARRAVQGAEANPLLLVAGGVALGAAMGALLPRSERERTLMAPIGQRLGDAIGAAVEAGREAGKAELDSNGISRDAARDQVRSLLSGIMQAASTAGSAAAHAAASTRKPAV